MKKITLLPNYSTITEKVKEHPANRIEVIIQEDGIELLPAGRELKGFHSTKHSGSGSGKSLNVNPAKQVWICWPCQKGGDVIAWRQNEHGMSFREALEYLAKRAGITLPDVDPEAAAKYEAHRTERQLLEKLYFAAATVYNEQLTEKHYQLLENKWGLSRETADSFLFGFAPAKTPFIAERLLQKGFYEDLITRSGLINRGGFDHFTGRLIFPYWKNGQPVFFIARQTEDIPESEFEQAKFKKLLVHSENNKHVSEAVRNEFFAGEDSATGAAELILTEGIADCYAALQHGFNCVSPVTVRFRAADLPHLASLASKAETVYICNDAEAGAAGEEGALATAEHLETQGISVKLIQLPRPEEIEKVDLADYLRDHGPDAFRELMNQAKSLLLLAFENLERQPQSEAARDEALQRIAKIENEVKRESEISKFKLITRIGKQAIRKEIAKIRRDATADDAEQKKDEEPEQHTANFPGLVDIVADEAGDPAFLILKDGELIISKEQTNQDDELLQPPRKEAIPFLLANAEDIIEEFETDSDAALFVDLVKHFKNVSELPTESHYELLAWWTLHTYVHRKGEYSPYLWFFAIPERGKSRTGKAAIHLAYRGIHVESMRDAYLIRISHNFNASLFFDVMDLWKKAEKAGAEDLLLLRFEHGAVVARVLYPDKGPFKDTVYFEIYGPTLCATNEPVHNILETRALQINMPASTRTFEQDIKAADALPLKARLTAFRARNLEAELPAANKPCAGRLGDITRPLLQLVKLVDPSREEDFRRLVKTLKEDRDLEKSSSREAQILQAIIDLRDEVYSQELHVKTIAEKYNEEIKNERYHITPRSAGGRLSAMGFKKRRTREGIAITYDEAKIQILAEQYGIKFIAEGVPIHTQKKQHDVHEVNEPFKHGGLECERCGDEKSALSQRSPDVHTGSTDNNGAGAQCEHCDENSECVCTPTHEKNYTDLRQVRI